MEIKNNNGEAEAKEAKTDDSQQDPAPESTNSDETKSDNGATVDYKAELEKIRKEKELAEQKLKKAEFALYKKSKEGKPKEESQDDDDFERPDELKLKETMQRELARSKEEYKLELARDNVETELEKYADDLDRQELIKYHYENTINRSGYARVDIRKDLELAAFLADRPKFEAKMSEINKAIAAEKSKNKGGIASGEKISDDTILELTDADKKLLNRHGLTEKDVITNLNSK